MTTPIPCSRRPALPPARCYLAALAALLAAAPLARAADSNQDHVVQLNPFEVRSETDTGYGALQSNSLTAFRIDLDKMPATAQVFTRTFMDDIGATSIQDVLTEYSGTIFADPLAEPGDRNGSGGELDIRGLPGGAPKRDGLTGTRSLLRSASGYTDSFDTERIEVIQGPQSLLYGAAGGGGVINQVSKRARFDHQGGFVQTRIDEYGTKRGVFDYNVGNNKFAFRVAGAGEKRRLVRYNLGGDFYGLYMQAAYRILPKTTLRVFHERVFNWGIVSYTPGIGDLQNFFYQHDASGNIVRNSAGVPVVDTHDPRRAQGNVNYLAMTGQLANLQGVLWNGPVDFYHISSFGTWWSSEKVDNKYTGINLQTALPWNFNADVTAIYSETLDDRFTQSKNLVPAAGYTGSGANPFDGTAIRVTPGENFQSDRTRDIAGTLMRDDRFRLWKLPVHSQTALRGEYLHQGPAFGSSGIDELYYKADANWNAIISPTVTSDYGRIPIGSIYYPIQAGIPLKPVFAPGTRRITIGGQNYVLEPRIKQDPALVSPTNPAGLVPNNPTKSNPNGFSGNWNRGGETHNELASLANFTEWGEDGRLTTLIGASLNRFETLNIGPSRVTYLAPRNYWGYQFGANYALWHGLRVYANVSTAGMAAGTTNDFYGNPLKVPKAKSPTPEVGVKYYTPDGKFTLQLAHNFSTEVQNQTINAGTAYFNAVNPNGINGRFNAGDQWINVDRKSSSTELTIAANPTHNWRLAFRAINLTGEVLNTVAYKQLYNDQFYTNGGDVSYADGTPVMVDPAGKGGAATAPLTLAMINDATNPYWAHPDPISGSITSSLLRTTLTAVNPVHGAAATGVTGLPISDVQYAWSNPGNGTITVVQAGDKNTGINEYTLNFQSAYRFSSGPLKGFGIFGDLRTYYKNRAYYVSYYPSGTTNAVEASRVLYRLPSATVINLGLSYEHRLGTRYEWKTQVNIYNLFNHYHVWVVPNASNGANLLARFSAEPRSIAWTNTISF